MHLTFIGIWLSFLSVRASLITINPEYTAAVLSPHETKRNVSYLSRTYFLAY